VKDLATTTNAIAQVTVGAERIRDLLDADSIIPENPEGLPAEALGGDIEFQHVVFGYEPSAPVLKDVSFQIKQGQFVGIVGSTGSGKSTLVSLIPRFYDVQAGAIRIDGHDIRDYRLNALRDQIGYVLQDTVLFRGTILENLAFGRPRATRDEIIAAAKVANADDFIRSMPNGYDALVVSVARHYRAGNGSELVSLALCCATVRSCFSMNQQPPWIAKQKKSWSRLSKD
jgi:subfamily B ATP-binding cassette protein MsbA